MKKVLLLAIATLFYSTTFAFGDFIDHLDSFNRNLFHTADGWTNGEPFNCTWRSNCVTFDGGIMTLALNRESGSPPFKCGEYRTNDNFSYGYFEVRMKATNKVGTLNSFFTYTGPSENNPWDEIDIEILGKNPRQMQTNYYTNGVGGHETLINLGFDASADFHVYGFEWRENYIKWYVDGKLVHTEDGSRGPLPKTPGKIMMNHWPGTGVDGWLGPFDGATPQYAYYDYVSYSKSGPNAGSAPGGCGQ
ncbi:MAG: glycoside hydrolase family 16 protein [Desulfobacteraceae bacterium]|jgi:beta-glucanase (GH16 family)